MHILPCFLFRPSVFEKAPGRSFLGLFSWVPLGAIMCIALEYRSRRCHPPAVDGTSFPKESLLFCLLCLLQVNAP